MFFLAHESSWWAQPTTWERVLWTEHIFSPISNRQSSSLCNCIHTMLQAPCLWSIPDDTPDMPMPSPTIFWNFIFHSCDLWTVLWTHRLMLTWHVEGSLSFCYAEMGAWESQGAWTPWFGWTANAWMLAQCASLQAVENSRRPLDSSKAHQPWLND